MPDTLCGLTRSAALCTLGRQLYETWGVVYGLEAAPPWDELTPEERHIFLQHSQDLIEFLAPDPAPPGLLRVIARALRQIIPFPEGRHAR